MTKRAQHHISLTHMPTGESHHIGTISRVSRSCVAAYMRRAGWDRVTALNIPVTELEFLPPDKSRNARYQVRAKSGDWELYVADTGENSCAAS